MPAPTIVLKDLTEREFGSTDRHHPWVWTWIVDTVAERFECGIDDVSLLEDDDGVEIISVRGEPQARIVYRFH
jgi:hypothetical protein